MSDIDKPGKKVGSCSKCAVGKHERCLKRACDCSCHPAVPHEPIKTSIKKTPFNEKA